MLQAVVSDARPRDVAQRIGLNATQLNRPTGCARPTTIASGLAIAHSWEAGMNVTRSMEAQ
jgi:hypothetical protein